MRISVFGMGYVGCTTAACLAGMGHEVIGVEPNPMKVERINQGASPVVEKGLDEAIRSAVSARRLVATEDWRSAVHGTEVAMISVGTPSRENGSLDVTYLRRVCEQIGEALADRPKGYFTTVVRSTVLPGTVESAVIPTLERRSGRRPGVDFGVCMNPEFLREGTSIEDFHNPPKTVIGQMDERSGDALVELYRGLPGPVVRTPLRVAEMVKYVDNAFHALKVAFANEIGNVCKPLGIDSHSVMGIFCLDTKLNLSPYYLKPGFAFGGSCLPKDLRALNHEARAHDLELPLLGSILESNRRQVARVASKLTEFKGRGIGFLGLSFKAGTDDLRESPLVELVEFALGKGFRIGIYDRHVAVARLTGSNKEFIEKQIPHIASLLVPSAEQLVRGSEVLVIGNRNPEYRPVIESFGAGKILVDLVRLFDAPPPGVREYYGVGW